MRPRWSERKSSERVGPGSRGRGRSYEKRVGAHLHRICAENLWRLRDHEWIDTGAGFLQPDFVIERPDDAILIECKLTWLDCSQQVSKYLRVLEELGLTPVPLLVCRNLTPSAPAPIHSLDELRPNAVWHLWI